MAIEKAVYHSSSWVIYWTAAGNAPVVLNLPVAAFTIAQKSGNTITFDGSSSSEQGGNTIVKWTWNFGDGSPAVSAPTPTVSHSYTRDGNYSAQLIVTDNVGGAAEVSHTVAINSTGKPTASFTSALNGSTVSLNASSSSDASATIQAYAWNFGDGATGSGVTVTHAYASPGTYSITLTVTDALGATATTTNSVVISAPPTAAFNSTVTNLAVACDASPTIAPSPIASYSWTFGDGGTASGKTVNHTYASAGTFTISLTVKDVTNQSSLITHNVTIAGTPVAQPPVASFTSTATNLTANFDASASIDPDGTITSYSWTFGDSISTPGSTKVITVGDSLTYGEDGGGTTWPNTLASLTSLTVVNAATTPSSSQGWTSVDAAIRMGALNPALSASAAIPASGGSVTVTMSNVSGVHHSVGNQKYTGTLNGVTGLLTHVSGTTNSYTFVPSSGSGSTAPAGALFHCTDFDAYVGAGYDFIFMLGRNDLSEAGATGAQTNVKASIDAILARFNPTRYLVVGTIADPDTGTVHIVGDKTNNVFPLDTALQSHYGSSHFMSAQTYLASTAALTAVGLTPQGNDASQISAGDVPDSLSAVYPNVSGKAAGYNNRCHLDANGYKSLGIAIKNTINSNGWLSSVSSGGTGSGVTTSHTYATAGAYTVNLTVTDNSGLQTSVSRSVTVANSGGQQQAGTGITLYQNATGSDINGRVNSIGSNKLSLEVGKVYSLDGFQYGTANSYTGYGASTSSATGILGAGPLSSQIKLTTNSMTQTAPTSGVNQFIMFLFSNIPAAKVDNLAIIGTTQSGGAFNGLRFNNSANPSVTRTLIKNVTGTSPSPPGETFFINHFGGSGGVFDTLEFDGSNGQPGTPTAWKSSSMLATNSVSGAITIRRLYGHESQWGKSFAGWLHGTSTDTHQVSEVWTVNTDFGFGWEECGGTWYLDDCVFGGNWFDGMLAHSNNDWGAKGGTGAHIIYRNPQYIGTDGQLYTYEGSGKKLKLYMPTTYTGHGSSGPNTQTVANDVEVWFGSAAAGWRKSTGSAATTYVNGTSGNYIYSGTPLTNYTKPSWALQ